MAVPKNKTELLKQAEENYSKLIELVDTISPENLEKPGVNNDWSVKDVLSHLHEWHNMMAHWYKEGKKGEKPEMPIPGYTWKDIPKLNEKIYHEYKKDSWNKVFANLKRSHKKMMKIITDHSDKDLFTKKKFSFTGSSSLAVYLRLSTSSHYDWAIKLIDKWQKGKKE